MLKIFKMKWLFFLAGLYIFLMMRAPQTCDVKSLQQCTPDEIQKIQSLETKSKEELNLLLDMRDSELEIARQQLLENFHYIKRETQSIEHRIKLLNTLYKDQVTNYEEKLAVMHTEYRTDLIRRILLERDKIEDTLNRLERSDTSACLI